VSQEWAVLIRVRTTLECYHNYLATSGSEGLLETLSDGI
jgi:hypothetical protein